jgi:hypothetical protein
MGHSLVTPKRIVRVLEWATSLECFQPRRFRLIAYVRISLRSPHQIPALKGLPNAFAPSRYNPIPISSTTQSQRLQKISFQLLPIINP